MTDAPNTASGNDLSALIPDGPYGDLKKKKAHKKGKLATKLIISFIGRRPIGDSTTKN